MGWNELTGYRGNGSPFGDGATGELGSRHSSSRKFKHANPIHQFRYDESINALEYADQVVAETCTRDTSEDDRIAVRLTSILCYNLSHQYDIPDHKLHDDAWLKEFDSALLNYKQAVVQTDATEKQYKALVENDPAPESQKIRDRLQQALGETEYAKRVDYLTEAVQAPYYQNYRKTIETVLRDFPEVQNENKEYMQALRPASYQRS